MELIDKYITFTKKEEWKSVVGFEGRYDVSSLGNIKNCKTKLILTPWINTRGYKSVTLIKDGKKKSYKVHKLIAETFLNHSPSGMLEVVDHINSDPLDNRVDNLQIISQRANMSKSIRKTSSKFTGVCWDKRARKWVANISIDRTLKFLKSSNCELSCAYAYNMKLKEILIK